MASLHSVQEVPVRVSVPATNETSQSVFEPVTRRKSARWLLAAAKQKASQLYHRVKDRVTHHEGGSARLEIGSYRARSGLWVAREKVRMGPNSLYAWIGHPDGSIEVLGESQNLMTNIGCMALIGNWGAIPAGGAGSPATATSGTTITATGTPWTASNLATPQLGLAGFRVYAPVTGLTTAPVYGNIVSNTTSVATIDQWWTATDTVGTTPASTNAFIIGAAGISGVRFVALTTDSGAAAATHTTLTSELTTNSLGRALGTFARGANPSGGSGTCTLSKTFTVTGGTVTAIHRAGAFMCLTVAGADPEIFDTVLNADATVTTNDTLALTWTFTLSG